MEPPSFEAPGAATTQPNTSVSLARPHTTTARRVCTFRGGDDLESVPKERGA